MGGNHQHQPPAVAHHPHSTAGPPPAPTKPPAVANNTSAVLSKPSSSSIKALKPVSAPSHAYRRRISTRNRQMCGFFGLLVAGIIIMVAVELVTHSYDQKDLKELIWTSEGGQIRLDGYAFHFKGVSWYGMEGQSRTPQGLDKVKLDHILGLVKGHGFNALRLPLSLDFALQPDQPLLPSVASSLVDLNLRRLTHIQLLNKIVDRAADHGLLVVLDMHCLVPGNLTSCSSPLWYDKDLYPQDKLLQGWDNLLSAVGHKWNVVGLDLFNEPTEATWGTGHIDTDWALGAAHIATHIMNKFHDFNGLLLVQGVQYPSGPQGGKASTRHSASLEGVVKDPIDLKDPVWNTKIVYSSHVYAPASDEQYFQSYKKPENLDTLFNKQEQWSFAQDTVGRAVLLGAWGGATHAQATAATHTDGEKAILNTAHQKWAEAVVDFLVSSCSSGNFYWALNPSPSTGYGGLLQDDWQTPNKDLLHLLDQAQPNPSRLEILPREKTLFKTSFAYHFTKGNWPSHTCRYEMKVKHDINLDTSTYQYNMTEASADPAVITAKHQKLRTRR